MLKIREKSNLQDDIKMDTPLYNASVQWFNENVSPSDNEFLTTLWKAKNTPKKLQLLN